MGPSARLILGMALLVTGFSSGLSRADALSDNLAKWESMRPAHYQYKRSRGCYCQPKTYLVEAEGEKVTKAEFIPATTDFSPESLQSLSIDSLFGQIKHYQSTNPYKLEVTYDSGFGFPKQVYLDNRQNVADDELTLSIFEFKILATVALLPSKTGRGAGAPKGLSAGLYRKEGEIYAPNGRNLGELKQP